MKKITSYLTLVLMLVVTMFGVSGCFGSNYNVKHFIDEAEAKNRLFSLRQTKEDGSNVYFSNDYKVSVAFKDGKFSSAYLLDGSSLQLAAQDHVVYITDGPHTYYYSSTQCLINNDAYDIKSDSCKQSISNPTNYGKYIKQNFPQILK